MFLKRMILLFIVFTLMAPVCSQSRAHTSKNLEVLLVPSSSRGFDHEVSKLLAKHMGRTLKLTHADADFFVNGTLPQNIDVIMGQIPLTSKHLTIIQVIGTYAQHPVKIAVHKSNTTINNTLDLKEKIIGTTTGTLLSRWVDGSLVLPTSINHPSLPKLYGKRKLMYESLEESLKDLAVGDGVYVDAVIVDDHTLHQPHAKKLPIKTLDQQTFFTHSMVGIVQKRSEITPSIISGLKNLDQKGTLSELISKKLPLSKAEWSQIQVNINHTP